VNVQFLPCVPYRCCVLDVALIGGEFTASGDREAGAHTGFNVLEGAPPTSCVIVEVNPYSRATDACLYSWVMDAKQLQHGPVELRVNTGS